MTGVEILLIVSIVIETIATAIALYLVNKTRFSAMWICCIIGLVALMVQSAFRLLTPEYLVISDLAYAWVGIIISLSFSIAVVLSRYLVRHVDLVTLQRRMLENRLMTAVLRTEERSRASFSRELHDGLGPLLSSAKMSLSAMSKSNLNDKDRAIVQNTSALIDEAIRSLREISNNLSPHILNNFGLARGIKNFIDRLATMHSTKIAFTTHLRDERFDSNIEVIIYRVVCELINNSLKHAHCTEIRLSLELEQNRLVLTYSDNGCGFNVADVMDKGMGLSNITSRINSLNGSLNISSKSGNGMRAEVKIGTKPGIAVTNRREKLWRIRR
jgi:signal transduction histidine kinase